MHSNETFMGMKSDRDYWRDQAKSMELTAQYEAKVKLLDIEKAKTELRKEMQKALIESDLKRVKAEACLTTYEKMDTKDERQHIRGMLEKAIEALSKARVEVIK